MEIDEAEQMHRKINFGLEANDARHPLFDGEKIITMTHNGYQSYSFTLAPHEAAQMVELLRKSFNLNGEG